MLGDKKKKPVEQKAEQSNDQRLESKHKSNNAPNKSEKQDELAMARNQLQEAQMQVEQAKQREQRALADYQNLLRRTESDRSKFAKFANKALVEDLLQPLEHLSMAAEHLNDPGLHMAVQQLWKQLEEHGVQEIEVMGKEFDVQTMEVVENGAESADPEDGSLKVTKVVRRGYTLNGEVLQHAKVVLGK